MNRLMTILHHLSIQGGDPLESEDDVDVFLNYLDQDTLSCSKDQLTPVGYANHGIQKGNEQLVNNEESTTIVATINTRTKETNSSKPDGKAKPSKKTPHKDKSIEPANDGFTETGEHMTPNEMMGMHMSDDLERIRPCFEHQPIQVVKETSKRSTLIHLSAVLWTKDKSLLVERLNIPIEQEPLKHAFVLEEPVSSDFGDDDIPGTAEAEDRRTPINDRRPKIPRAPSSDTCNESATKHHVIETPNASKPYHNARMNGYLDPRYHVLIPFDDHDYMNIGHAASSGEANNEWTSTIRRTPILLSK